MYESTNHSSKAIITGLFAIALFSFLFLISPAAQARVSLTDLQNQINALQELVTAQQEQIATQQDTIDDLSEKLQNVYVDGANLVFEGVNVQIVDGTGDTDGSVNGLGNLIVGYNEIDNHNGFPDYRTGSHNVIIGAGHSYRTYGCFIAGYDNTIWSTAPYASISGGSSNSAGYAYSSVSGGSFNRALGEHSSVSGGYNNATGADYASISGGEENTASAISSSITGGYRNFIDTSGNNSCITGGRENLAYAYYAGVSGGKHNRANHYCSQIGGGQDQVTLIDYDFKAFNIVDLSMLDDVRDEILSKVQDSLCWIWNAVNSIDALGVIPNDCPFD